VISNDYPGRRVLEVEVIELPQEALLECPGRNSDGVEPANHLERRENLVLGVIPHLTELVQCRLQEAVLVDVPTMARPISAVSGETLDMSSCQRR